MRTREFKPPFRQKPPQKSACVFTITVPHEFGPAFKSAIEEISNIVGSRLEGPRSFAQEEALTKAAAVLGTLRAAISAQVKHGSADYA